MSDQLISGENALSSLGTTGDINPSLKREFANAQNKALELLIAGKTIAEAARAICSSRTTIYRWLKNDPEFREAYEEWQAHIQATSRARLLTLTDKAAAAVERSLEMGDARTAMQLLKGLGVLGSNQRDLAVEPKDRGPKGRGRRGGDSEDEKAEALPRMKRITVLDTVEGIGKG
jgi:hypothetical protein